jgi:acetamidase/formamidase
MQSCTFAVAFLAFSSAAAGQTVHEIEPTPQTVAWGYYDAAARPALRIRSGDVVRARTLLTSSPSRLEAMGVAADQVEPALREIYRTVTDKGPGGHILTGPIYVEGAEPGDTLEVRIQQIDLAIPYAYNGFRPGAGFLTEDYPYARSKLIALDKERGVARFGPGIEIPLRPFFGSLGVAPPEANGRISSGPPWMHAGNLDNKELVAGTTLFIPVFVRGALFEVGDGHAGQGDGEVDITALETSLIGTFRLVVRKDLHIKWPRAETPTYYIAMGIHEDLTTATRMAIREAIDFLVSEKKLSRDDAYMLASVAVDFHITQLVDGNKGVHAMIPRFIFK